MVECCKQAAEYKRQDGVFHGEADLVRKCSRLPHFERPTEREVNFDDFFYGEHAVPAKGDLAFFEPERHFHGKEANLFV